MKPDSFYNTVHLTSSELSQAEANALTQEQKVLRFFIQQGPKYQAAPSAVGKRVFDNSVPLTSVRRAMTSLTARGDLVKSQAMIIGPYGKPEHLWTISAKWDRTAEPVQGSLL